MITRFLAPASPRFWAPPRRMHPEVLASQAVFSDDAVASLVLSAEADTTVDWSVDAAAGLVLTAEADAVRDVPVDAELSLLLYGEAVAAVEYPVDGAASFVLSARATLTHPFPCFTGLYLSASAATTVAWLAGAAAAPVLFRVRADVQGIHPTSSRALLVLRARARVPSLLEYGHSEYLGRVQAGRELSLQVQALAQHGGPVLPRRAIVARLYREGQFVRTFVLPMEPQAQVTGRFALDLLIDRTLPAGRYAVVYSYDVTGLVRVGLDCFEVVSGGDPAGLVLALYALPAPLGEITLAQLEGGSLVMGQGSYLEDGT